MEKITLETPALLFSPKYDTLEYIPSEEIISVTNKLGLKKGIMLGNFIVDSAGRTFKTVGAKKRGNVHKFWKFEFFNPLIFIELKLEDLGSTIDVTTLKEKILRVINAEKSQWSDDDLNDIFKAVRDANNPRELIAGVRNYFHSEEKL